LGFSAAASLFNAAADAHDRFWMKRYGPSRRCTKNASAALGIFVRHPKKDFCNNICQKRTIPYWLNFYGLTNVEFNLLQL
jgi:hypothetical protein